MAKPSELHIFDHVLEFIVWSDGCMELSWNVLTYYTFVLDFVIFGCIISQKPIFSSNFCKGPRFTGILNAGYDKFQHGSKRALISLQIGFSFHSAASP